MLFLVTGFISLVNEILQENTARTHTHAHIKEHAQIQQTPAQNRIIPLSNSVPVKVVDVVKYIVSGHTENGNWPGEAWHHISVPAWLGWILAGSGSGR